MSSILLPALDLGLPYNGGNANTYITFVYSWINWW